MVEEALKERHIKGQSVRAVIFVDILGMRSVGPTPKLFRCRTYSAPLITHLPNNSPYGLPFYVSLLQSFFNHMVFNNIRVDKFVELTLK